MPISAGQAEDGHGSPQSPHRGEEARGQSTPTAVRISLAVLAYNEESGIADTIGSIAKQSLVQDLPRDWTLELVCVPNGCRDRTAEVASHAIDDLLRSCRSAGVSARVDVIDRASKENAWNEFVHRISRRDAEFLIFMDGDVRLVHQDSLRNMIEALRAHPQAYVCGARTIKHLEGKSRRTLMERFSMAATGLRSNWISASGLVGFAGCLYAARSAACRRLRLPSILRGEDSFLHAMWATDFFTVPVNQRDPTRVILAPDATVLFEAYVSPRQVLKNLRRRAVGITINSMLYDRLWAESKHSEDGGQLLIRWHREDPTWDQAFLLEKIKERGRWVPPGGPFLRWISPSGNLWVWLRRMKGLSLRRKLVHLPVAVVGTCLTLYSYVAANRLIRSGRLDNLWFTTRTNLRNGSDGGSPNQTAEALRASVPEASLGGRSTA